MLGLKYISLKYISLKYISLLKQLIIIIEAYYYNLWGVVVWFNLFQRLFLGKSVFNIHIL